MVGDLANGRTARSLCYLLAKFKGNTLFFVSPEHLKMKEDIKHYLQVHEVTYREETDLESILPEVDVLYMTRIQRERMRAKEYERAKGKYVINLTKLLKVRREARILHPLPKIDEIQLPIDLEEKDPRIAYFRQAENGLYIRMALLYHLLGRDNFNSE